MGSTCGDLKGSPDQSTATCASQALALANRACAVTVSDGDGSARAAGQPSSLWEHFTLNLVSPGFEF